MSRLFGSFAEAIRTAEEELLDRGNPVHSTFWQGLDVSKMPAAEMVELLNWNFRVPLNPRGNIDYLQSEIEPNLPWADLHFEQERVGGQPLNPGETWKIWPWGNSADKHRKSGEQFNHTYAERFWPKWAGLTREGKLSEEGEEHPWKEPRSPYNGMHAGIRYRYADLWDVINTLAADPLTRQAYIPIWFPEDGSHMDRKPCTLGYHLIMRGGFLHMNYYIRSCDIFRHFRDDIYLAVRLQMWILDQLKGRQLGNDAWKEVKLGMFSMYITSLHCFINDRRELAKRHGRD